MFRIAVISLSVISLFLLGVILKQINSTPGSSAEQAKRAEAQRRLYWKVVGQCQRSIENAAKYDLRWTDGMSRPIFTRDSMNNDLVGLWGDAAEAQNGFGNWVRVNYRCTFNQKTNQVVDVSIESGRLR